MVRQKSTIPYYTDINTFLASIPSPGRTINPLFYCLRLKKLERPAEIYKPPFKRSFYFFALFVNSGNAQINYGDKTVTNPEAYLVFHSPDLVYSFSHDETLEGYVIYFKSECFSFFKPDLHEEFPFFNRLYTNLFKLDQASFQTLAPHFEDVVASYERSGAESHMEARARLLALFYYMKVFAAERKKITRFATPQCRLPWN
ncbi:hypothetical protein SAMN04487996_113216 [Dyadobacter soli]|uniref:AraC-like ligand binding domain-containing protein n=1 Tax=Dyadobacter soli TaxID=659014 RepID=A0A1G7Q2C8_9BACT|nr:hypothetical protein SAMN04487996_113216 [Dyadobacter soli]